jgi:aminopyrrolnitrin oxygenase
MSEYPKSWYVAAKACDLKIGKIEELSLFNKSYIIYRTTNDEVAIFEKYCPHMGAALSLGKIIDDCIQCPFHHWSYDREGTCVNIPSLDRIPSKAKLKKIFSREMYGLIWIWYGDEPLFELPAFNAALEFKNNYLPLRSKNFMQGSLRQVLENSYNCAQFIGLHGIKPSSKLTITNLDEYRDRSLKSCPEIDEVARYGVVIDCPNLELDFVSSLFGIKGSHLSIVVDGWPSGQFITSYLDGKELYQVMLGVQPIDRDTLIQHVHVMTKKCDNLLTDWFNYLFYALQNRYGTSQKTLADRTSKSEDMPLITGMDLGVMEFSKFYSYWTREE